MESSVVNSGQGRLVVFVTTANGALPVENATVTVMNEGGEQLEILTTDKSGRTRTVYLDAPSSIYSQEPGNILPFSRYNIKVDKDGYYSQEFLNVPIFDRIESIQPVPLEPLGEDATENDKIVIVDEKTENSLAE